MEHKKYRDIIKTRVPEYYQTDSELMEYLDVCGELFDELANTIRSFDDLNDYRHVPQSRLTLLARRFAFNPPRGIPQSMMRGIIRDIASIYSTGGTEQALFWVFRLLGWGVRTEYAWLLNPERYDPEIRNVYPEFYDASGLTSDLSYANSVFVPIGSEYEIGAENQPYVENTDFIFAGYLSIGRNELTYVGSGSATDPFSPQNPPLVTTDFNKINYRNFVYGEEKVESTGTFFYGRTPFSAYDNLRQIRILGEQYTSESPRYTDVVMKTPYVMVTVDESDYAQFTQPYEVDGVEYNYTESESFTIADTLINYFMTDTTRPSPVRVVLTTGHVIGEDIAYVSEDLTEDFTAAPQSVVDGNIFGTDTDIVDSLTVQGTGSYVIGTPGIHIGTPSFMPVNSLNVIQMGQIGDSRQEYTFQFASDTYSFGRTFGESDFIQEGTEYVSEKLPVRTPSSFTITPSSSVAVQIRRAVTGSFSDYTTLNGGTTYNLTSNDVNYIRFKTGDPTGITVSIDITWNSQVGYTLPFTYPSLVAA